MELLTEVEFAFPQWQDAFFSTLSIFLHDVAVKRDHSNELRSSNPLYYPKIFFRQDSTDTLRVRFLSYDRVIQDIPLVNVTGQEVESPHTYTKISLAEVSRRLGGHHFMSLDHVGFNLPWFGTGVHPDIATLRQNISRICLYHTFPTGEPWDFVLPAKITEITGETSVNYSQVRKPKLEIVSFDKSSTPLIQIDGTVNKSYAEIAELFPEGIADQELENVWVYLENPYHLDLCFVINKKGNSDWSDFFAHSRLM